MSRLRSREQDARKGLLLIAAIVLIPMVLLAVVDLVA